MKTYEELLSDIEDDMELMGELHIVYAMEENGVLTGYDYLPEEPYTISVTLKDLQEKISLLGTDAHYFSTFDEIEDFLLENCVPQDLLITMGAGDVYKIGEHLLGL